MGYYGEVSGKLAEILIIKYGVPVVSDEAEVEAAIGGKNVEWHGQHPKTIQFQEMGGIVEKLEVKCIQKYLLEDPNRPL